MSGDSILLGDTAYLEDVADECLASKMCTCGLSFRSVKSVTTLRE